MNVDKERKEVYIKAVKKSLNDLLGATATSVIYNYLESRCGIKQEELSFKTEEFKNQLKQILGTSAKIVEDKIDKNVRKD